MRADCVECETKEGRIDRIERELQITGDLTARQRSRLVEIVERCQVHRTVTFEIDIRTQAV
jgi:putative redox protein